MKPQPIHGFPPKAALGTLAALVGGSTHPVDFAINFLPRKNRQFDFRAADLHHPGMKLRAAAVEDDNLVTGFRADYMGQMVRFGSDQIERKRVFVTECEFSNSVDASVNRRTLDS